MSKYFQDELNYLRDVGREMARLNPKLEKYLGESSTDPDVARLMESFAFLTSRVRERIEDELPEVTHGILQRLWPNFLRPLPPVAMIKFSPVERALSGRHVVRKGTPLFSRPLSGTSCRFQTTADCTVYPFEIAATRLERTRDASRLRIDFTTLSGQPLAAIGLDDLRLHLTGDSHAAQMLYLWSLCHTHRVKLFPDDEDRARLLPADALQPGAMSLPEALLPGDGRHFDGHRLMREFHAFPDKFLCLDLHHLRIPARTVKSSGFTLEIEHRPPLPVDIKLREDTIQLYCVPALNRFQTDSAPISFRTQLGPHDLRPRDAVGRMAIFSIDGVTSHVDDGSVREHAPLHSYAPYESLTHRIESAAHRTAAYYREHLLPLLEGDGFRHKLDFVRHDGKPARPADDEIVAQLTGFNGDLPCQLAPGEIASRYQAAAPTVTYRNLTAPTAPLYTPLEGALAWDMISNLSLNIMSLRDPKALGAVLSVYDHRAFSDRQAERAGRKRLDSIFKLETKPVDRIFSGRPVRGLETRMILLESGFANLGELYLFGSVLAEYFALYATTNSFHKLAIMAEPSGRIYQWPAKLGRQPLI